MSYRVVKKKMFCFVLFVDYIDIILHVSIRPHDPKIQFRSNITKVQHVTQKEGENKNLNCRVHVVAGGRERGSLGRDPDA